MKYYSEMLDSLFDSEKELKEAEEKVRIAKEEKEKREQKVKEERAKRAKEVEAAQEVAIEAIQNYRELLSRFCEDYGSFHMTLDKDNIPFRDLFGMFRDFF